MKCRDSLFVGSGAVARGQTDKTVTRKVVFFCSFENLPKNWACVP